MEKMGIIKQVKSEYGVVKLDFKPYEVEHIQEGNEIIYCLVDPYLIYDLLVIHKENVLDDEEFRQMFEYIEFGVETGIPDKISSPRDAVDSLIKLFWDMFPPSFRC